MDSLKKFFVSDELHERVVTLPDGTQASVHFRELPAVEFQRFRLAEQSEDENVRAGSIAKLLTAGVCKPDGTPLMTYKDALRLKPAAAGALFEALLIANGMKGEGNA